LTDGAIFALLWFWVRFGLVVPWFAFVDLVAAVVVALVVAILLVGMLIPLSYLLPLML
jgi:hypothetical protein